MPARRAFGFAAGLALLAAVRPAVAAPAEATAVLTLDIGSDVDERPSHLCLLHRAGAGDSLPLPDALLQPAPAADRGATGRDLRVLLGEPADLLRRMRAAAGMQGDGLDPQVAAVFHEALLLLTMNRSGTEPQGGPCGPDAADTCRPALRVPSAEEGSNWLTCARNTQATRGPQRVLVVSLALRTKRDLPVRHVLLDGAAATVIADGSFGGQTIVASVAGGDYADEASVPALDGRVRLPVRARCVRREIHLPPTVRTGARALFVGVEYAGCPPEASWGRPTVPAPPPERCELPFAEPLLLWLPRERADCEKSLRLWVTERAAAGPAGSAAGPDASALADAAPLVEAEARWTSDTPPAPLERRVRGVSFSWQPRCEYPLRFAPGAPYCPAARLVQSGIPCQHWVDSAPAPPAPVDEPPSTSAAEAPAPSSGPLPACHYACFESGVAESARFDFPVAVDFALPNSDEHFTETVHHANQTLTGYVAREMRQFPVYFAATGRVGRLEMTGPDTSAPGCAAGRGELPRDRRERLGDRIWRLEIGDATGRRHEFTLDDTAHRITLPGGLCGDSLRYRYTGDRSYREGLVSICHGRIVVPPPEVTGRRVYFGLMLGGGLDLRFLEARAAADPVFNPFGLLQGVIRWQPDADLRGHAFFVEFQPSLSIGRFAYYPLAPTASGHAAEHTRLTVTRAFVNVAFAVSVASWIEVGVTAGGGFAAPFFYSSDRKRMGDGHGFFTAGPFGRWRFHSNVALEVGFRVFGPEPVRVFRLGDLAAEPARGSLEAWTLAADLGLRFWL